MVVWVGIQLKPTLATSTVRRERGRYFQKINYPCVLEICYWLLKEAG